MVWSNSVVLGGSGVVRGTLGGAQVPTSNATGNDSCYLAVSTSLSDQENWSAKCIVINSYLNQAKEQGRGLMAAGATPPVHR